MDHRPYEDWLLSEEPLTTEQKRQLQAHLRACPACAALKDVNLALHAARPVAPAEGFRARFQVRLAAQQKVQRRRTVMGAFVLSVGAFGLLLWLAWPLLHAIVASPSNFVSSLLSSLVNWWISFQAYRDTFSTFLRVLNGFIPSYVWNLLAMLAICGSLMWFVSLMKFTKVPQGV